VLVRDDAGGLTRGWGDLAAYDKGRMVAPIQFSLEESESSVLRILGLSQKLCESAPDGPE
jgi:hypothetical protein